MTIRMVQAYPLREVTERVRLRYAAVRYRTIRLSCGHTRCRPPAETGMRVLRCYQCEPQWVLVKETP